MLDCTECNEYGRCEAHQVVISRDGAAVRTADELLAVFIDDTVSLGAQLSPYGWSVMARVEMELDNERRLGVSWLDSDALRDELTDVANQAETELNTIGYGVDWEDGYVIYTLPAEEA